MNEELEVWLRGEVEGRAVPRSAPLVDPSVPGGIHVHHHYHAAPAAPAQPEAKRDLLAEWYPRIVLLVFLLIVLMIAVVVFNMMMPAILAMLGGIVAILTALAVMLGCVAVLAIAIAFSGRSLRQSKSEREIVRNTVRKGLRNK